MKRRDFIVNSLLAIGGAAFMSGCAKTQISSNKTTSDASKNSEGSVVVRKFKDLSLPLLGFGCMRFPTKGDAVDVAEVEKMVECAFKRGVNYFDTAYMYMDGKSENVIGSILRNYKRENFFLADKNPIVRLTSKEDVHKIFAEQLKKCGVEYFDFYMCHNINQGTYNQYKDNDVYNELVRYKKDGKIRNLGFSFHGTTPMLEEVVSEHPWDFCQLQINYLDWEVMNAKRHYEIAEKAKVPVIVMEPIRGGGLCNLSAAALNALKAEIPGETPASFALRWAAGKTNVMTVLSGMSNLKQMEENTATFVNYRPITDKEERLASQIAKIIQSQGEINCTACKYCVEDCPKGINIPQIFSLYNDYKKTGDRWSFEFYYNSIAEEERADKCIKCNLCKKNCPQSLDIPALLEMVAAEVKN